MRIAHIRERNAPAGAPWRLAGAIDEGLQWVDLEIATRTWQGRASPDSVSYRIVREWRLAVLARIKSGLLAPAMAAMGEDFVMPDLPQLEGHLLGLLHDEQLLSAPVLAPVRDYLLGAGERPDAVDLRRCQLAAELAQLFDEYGGSRPELLRAWAAGRHEITGPLADIEAWQAALWRAVFADGGLVAERGRREGITWLPLPALFAEAERTGRLAGAAGLAAMAVLALLFAFRLRGERAMLLVDRLLSPLPSRLAAPVSGAFRAVRASSVTSVPSR